MNYKTEKKHLDKMVVHTSDSTFSKLFIIILLSFVIIYKNNIEQNWL